MQGISTSAPAPGPSQPLAPTLSPDPHLLPRNTLQDMIPRCGMTRAQMDRGAGNVGSIEQLNETIHQQMERWQVPGLAIGLYDNGRVETAAYGVAHVETGCAVTPGTLFQIGSISKVFTTTLVMTLVEDGKLDLDIPVVRYVPELPLADETARRTITLRHLLTHMAGFYGDRFDDHGDGDDALAKAVAAFADLPQQTAPGELWTYCNAGFDLAGRAVERVLGMPFEQAMRERVFAPLGLERTTYFAKEAIRHRGGRGARPRARSAGRRRSRTPWPIPRRSNPAGGISSSCRRTAAVRGVSPARRRARAASASYASPRPRRRCGRSKRAGGLRATVGAWLVAAASGGCVARQSTTGRRMDSWPG
ncbi:MAG: hypothetical protein KatS3mg059_0651 [Thermomicrobiales bacterium]|nr:MAG: hypothetical protein KatS3mg059_0651 [Thermomicrobiales bacterium]